jgi:hypothetical protein
MHVKEKCQCLTSSVVLDVVTKPHHRCWILDFERNPKIVIDLRVSLCGCARGARARSHLAAAHPRLYTCLFGQWAGESASRSAHGVRAMVAPSPEPRAEPTASCQRQRSGSTFEGLSEDASRSRSGRVCAGGGRENEHPRAHTASCGGGTVVWSTSRPPQPTRGCVVDLRRERSTRGVGDRWRPLHDHGIG